MQIKAMMNTTLTRLASLPGDMKHSISYLPELRRNPSVIPVWLKGARAAQIVLLLSVLLVPTVLTKASDAVMGLVFRPVTKEHLFGLIETERENPRLQAARTTGRVLLYLGTLGTVGILLILKLPESVQQAGQRKPARPRPASGSTERTVVMEPPLPTSGPGERFSLTRVLGRGGMGIVHLALDTVLDRNVAVKELHTVFGGDEQLLARFRQEAKILAQLTHPGIVQIYDFLERNGQFWIVMEYIDGGELSEVMERGPMPVSEAAALGSALAGALGFAHERGVVHRDFKPSNVLINSTGSPKITDFGIARLAQTTGITREGTMMGSPSYMSPEQAEGKTADERTDIYALGVVLYQALSGQPPFSGDTIQAVIAQKITRDPEPLKTRGADVPEELDRFILGMLARDPEGRPKSMKDVEEFLKGYR